MNGYNVKREGASEYYIIDESGNQALPGKYSYIDTADTPDGGRIYCLVSDDNAEIRDENLELIHTFYSEAGGEVFDVDLNGPRMVDIKDGSYNDKYYLIDGAEISFPSGGQRYDAKNDIYYTSLSDSSGLVLYDKDFNET